MYGKRNALPDFFGGETLRLQNGVYRQKTVLAADGITLTGEGCGQTVITFDDYAHRLTDLFLFAVILTVFEVILHFAFKAFRGDFIFSPMLAITLIVMMRWGWPAVFYALGDGLLFLQFYI